VTIKGRRKPNKPKPEPPAAHPDVPLGGGRAGRIRGTRLLQSWHARPCRQWRG
jgi:hypothetical protein